MWVNTDMGKFRYFEYCLLLSIVLIGIDGQEDGIIKDVLARIETLENEGRIQKINNAMQEEKLQHLEAVIRSQDTIIRNLLHQLERQDEPAPDPKEDISQKHSVNENNDPEVITSDVDATKKKQSGMRAGRLVMEGPVAFQARIDKYPVTHIGLNQNILFDVVVTNIGGGYHPNHGLFIAPVGGIYIFSASILTDHTHIEFQANLMKNGSLLARVYGHADSGHDQGSVTVATQLSAGDEVWVSLRGPNDDTIWGDAFTTFSGCLVMFV